MNTKIATERVALRPLQDPSPPAGLSKEATGLLEVGSILGSSFVLTDAAEMLGSVAGRLLAPLDELIGASALTTVDSALAFNSETLHREVYLSIPEPVRLALHRQAGEMYLDRGGSAIPAARHFLLAARPGDRAALESLMGAACEILPAEPATAASLAESALKLTESGDPGRGGRVVLAVRCMTAAGRPGEAIALATDALASENLSRSLANELKVDLAYLRLMSGGFPQALQQLEGLVDNHELATTLRARAEIVRLLALLGVNDELQARIRAERIAGGGMPGDDAALAGALTVLGILAWNQGRARDALGLLRAAAVRADASAEVPCRTLPHLWLCLVCAVQGKFDEAGFFVRRASEASASIDDSLWAAVPAIVSSRLRLAEGSVTDAISEAQSGLDIAERMGMRFLVPLARSTYASAALAGGKLAEAERQISLAGELPGGRSLAGPVALLTEGRVCEAQKGPEAAYRLLSDVYDAPQRYRRLFLEEPGAPAWLIRLALSVGERARSEKLLWCVEAMAEDSPEFPNIAASAVHGHGLLNDDLDLLAAAADAQKNWWARACALEDAGEALIRRNWPERAVCRFELALEEFTNAGGRRDVARIRSRLRKLGVRRRHWTRDKRPVTGWAALTDTERRVSELVSQGLTNAGIAERMFLSRHTVDFHLRSIFRKLGISSRVELTRLAIEELPAEPSG